MVMRTKTKRVTTLKDKGSIWEFSSFNGMDNWFVLFDKNNNFVDKHCCYNVLHSKLISF